MKFIVDCMLGKLAKWLKVLGFDVLFFPKVEDDRLLDLARESGRIILSKDLGLIERAGGLSTLFIESEAWKAQVRQVVREFDLKENVKPFSRCLPCNAALKPLSARDVRNLVTPFIAERGESFALCRECGRIFWKGSHTEDMSARISELIDD